MKASVNYAQDYLQGVTEIEQKKIFALSVMDGAKWNNFLITRGYTVWLSFRTKYSKARLLSATE